MLRVRNYRKFIRFQERHPDLLEIEGWYETTMDSKEYKSYVSSGSNLAFGRWLIREKSWLPDEVAKFLSNGISQKIKISCRFNDFLRMAESNHYTACTAPQSAGWYGPVRLCENPNYMIIHVPDASGKFLGRIIAKLLPERQISFCEKSYGKIELSGIRKLFSDLNFSISNDFPDKDIWKRD